MNWYLIFACVFLLGLFGTLAIGSFRAYQREQSAHKGWNSWFDGPSVSFDALNDRGQPPGQRG